MTSDQFYFFCSHDTSIDTYPSSTPWDFRIDFSQQQDRLKEGKWNVSVCYIRCRADKDHDLFKQDRRTELHISANFCTWGYVNNVPLRYLCSFLLYSRDVDQKFTDQCITLELSSTGYSVLHLKILNNKLQPAMYMRNFVVLLLIY